MKNYRFLVQYDGSRYFGWEHQPGVDLTIQGKLEKVLSEMTGKEVEVIGAGRTDAGVHAKGMVCNAHMETNLSEREIYEYMNHYLPDDIGVKEVKVCSDRFHSRYNAMGKTYCYTCYVGDFKPMFNRKYVYVLDKKVDIELMKKGAKYLIGEHDFRAFQGNPKLKKSSVRIVDKIDIDLSGSYLNITYHGKGFLQYMVRIMTGTLLEIGFKERKPESILELFECKERKYAGMTVPAKGLCLLKVDYSNEIEK